MRFTLNLHFAIEISTYKRNVVAGISLATTTYSNCFFQMIHNLTSFGFSPDFSHQTSFHPCEDIQLCLADKPVIDTLHERGLVSFKTPIEAVMLCALCISKPLKGPNDAAYSTQLEDSVSVDPKLNTFFRFVDEAPFQKNSTALSSGSEWTFSYIPGRKPLRLSVRLAPNVYSQHSIQMFCRLIERTVKIFSSSPHSQLATLPMSSCNDISSIKAWDKTTGELPPFKPVGTLIASVSSRLPNNVAVVHGDGSFTLT